MPVHSCATTLIRKNQRTGTYVVAHDLASSTSATRHFLFILCSHTPTASKFLNLFLLSEMAVDVCTKNDGSVNAPALGKA